jgi:hypothetical protein
MAPVGRCRGTPLRAFRTDLHHHPSAVNERQTTTPKGDLALRERISHPLPFRQIDRSMEENRASFPIFVQYSADSPVSYAVRSCYEPVFEGDCR